MRNFASVNEVDDKDLVYNVYNRLENLTWCIRDRRYYDNMASNSNTIIKELKNIIKPEHEGLLNNVFLIHIFNNCSGRDKPFDIWKDYISRIKEYCGPNKLETIYRYLKIMYFYGNFNDTILSPGDMYCNEENLNYKEIFEQVITKFHEKVIFDRFYYEITNIRKDLRIGKANNTFTEEEFGASAIIISIIASYCLVMQDYDIFETMIDNFNERRNEILPSIILSGIVKLMKENDNNCYTKECLNFIQYIIETLSSKKNVNEQHRVIK